MTVHRCHNCTREFCHIHIFQWKDDKSPPDLCLACKIFIRHLQTSLQEDDSLSFLTCIRCGRLYFPVPHVPCDFDICYHCDYDDQEEEFLDDPLDYANSQELQEWEEAARQWEDDDDSPGPDCLAKV